MLTRQKKKTTADLRKELDDWFSKYIRKAAADFRGYVTCACGCGRRMRWQDAQVSHYISRGNMATRWDERNVFVASRECNYYDESHQDKLELKLMVKLGLGELNDLIAKSKSLVKLMPYELEEKIEYYKAKQARKEVLEEAYNIADRNRIRYSVCSKIRELIDQLK